MLADPHAGKHALAVGGSLQIYTTAGTYETIIIQLLILHCDEDMLVTLVLWL